MGKKTELETILLGANLGKEIQIFHMKKKGIHLIIENSGRSLKHGKGGSHGPDKKGKKPRSLTDGSGVYTTPKEKAIKPLKKTKNTGREQGGREGWAGKGSKGQTVGVGEI